MEQDHVFGLQKKGKYNKFAETRRVLVSRSSDPLRSKAHARSKTHGLVEDKSELVKSGQNMLSGFSLFDVSNGGNPRTIGHPDYLRSYSYPSNGSPNVQNGWTDLAPPLTAAVVNPRDWMGAAGKNRRTSPVASSHNAPRRRLSSGADSSSNSERSNGNRKRRSPSPYMSNNGKLARSPAVKPAGLSVASHSNGGSDNKDKRSPSSPTSDCVELLVTNLDQTYDPLVMKEMITRFFSQHVFKGVDVSVFVQANQTYAASVKVSSHQDAQLLISRFHRRKLLFGKINISLAHPPQQDLQYLKWQTISLLQDVPQKSLGLVKFLKMFESRYVTSVSMKDILKLSDVCTVSEEADGRKIALNQEYQDAVSPTFPPIQEIPPHCAKHYVIPQALNKGWAEQEARPLPNVMVPLSIFSANIKGLLASHGNMLPMSSLMDCYNAECGPLEAMDHGVPLEHYVTCVSQVELVTDGTTGIKYLRPGTILTTPIEQSEVESPPGGSSLATALKQFEREAVDLIKVQPHCQLLFSKFVPAYHHHFGRQCRVADYGFTKLIELLEAVPLVIQVMGEGRRRMVTLSHRAQMRRFTTDLIRALRTKTDKRMSFAELPAVFEWVFGRVFDPVDYGLCTLEDLLNHLNDSGVFVYEDGVLSIPQRKRTEVEEKRTKQFALEVVELLSLVPMYSMDFEKFIPTYHHHFSQQCRVSEFGFTKLIELFEAIPETVKIEEDSGERRLTLTFEKKIEVLSEQMVDLVYPAWPTGLHISNIETRYHWHYGYVLNPAVYGAANLEELVDKLDSIKIVETEEGKVVVPVEGALLRLIATKVRAFLINSEIGRMPLAELRALFSVHHEPHLTLQKLLTNMPDVVQLDEEDGVIVVELTPLYQIIRRLVRLIVKSEGRLHLTALSDLYESEFGVALDPVIFGFATLEDLLLDAPDLFVVRGKGFRRQVRLHKRITSSLGKPLHSGTLSGVAVCRPSSSCSISDTSIATSGDESTGKSPTPMVSIPELWPPEFNNNLYSPCKVLGALLPAHSGLPDPSGLPRPIMCMMSESDKENGVQSAFNPTYPDLFSDRPGSGLPFDSGSESVSPLSSGQTRRIRASLADQFNNPNTNLHY